MNATLGFGDGNALDAMDAAFEFELAVSIVARDFENDFFGAAGIVEVFGDWLDFEAVRFGVFLIHAVEFASEEARFVAAGAGADFDDGGLVVFGVFGDEELF